MRNVRILIGRLRDKRDTWKESSLDQVYVSHVQFRDTPSGKMRSSYNLKWLRNHAAPFGGIKERKWRVACVQHLRQRSN